MKMLIIDDEESVRLTLGLFAEMLDLDVVLHESPLSCVMARPGQCSCPENKPCCDLLLTDQNMPLMKGLELVQMLIKAGCRLPLDRIAVMSRTFDQMEKNAVQEVGCRVLQKPVVYEDLLRWVKGTSGRRA